MMILKCRSWQIEHYSDLRRQKNETAQNNSTHAKRREGSSERQQAKRRMDAPVRLRFASHLFPGSLRQIERMVNDMNLKEDSKSNETARGRPFYGRIS
jgi:hypothetical protein